MVGWIFEGTNHGALTVPQSQVLDPVVPTRPDTWVTADPSLPGQTHTRASALVQLRVLRAINIKPANKQNL